MRKMLALPWLMALALLQSPVHARDRKESVQLPPVPFVQREEVRFITLDLTGEEKRRGGWRPLRDLRREQVTVLVGDKVVELELFENHCAEASEPAAGRQTVDTAPPSTQASPDFEPEQVRFIIYLDMSRLTLEGWRLSLKALRKWADTSVQAEDPVMIAVAKIGGLRIIRPFLPASQHLHEDIDAAMEAGRNDEFWSNWMESRLRAAGDDYAFSGSIAGGGSLAALFAEEALQNQRALKNLRDAMTLFDSVEGTKNLIFFQQTFSLYSGQMSFLRQIARGANRRNVRIYGVAAGGGKVTDAITFLSTETGGRYVENTNDLGMILDRARDDAACFFRLGFRTRPSYDGSTKKIIVRVGGGSRYRLRHTRSLEDPTLEQMDRDMLLAAFLDPSAATAFPLSLEVVPLFDHSHGTRIRVQIQVPVSGLLSLPVMVDDENFRQMRVQAGVSVITLTEPDAAAGVQELGADVDEETKLLEFSRQSVLTFPASDAASKESRHLAFAEELDAPPGTYRLVLVVQDQLARTVAAAVTEFQVSDQGRALGPVRLLLEDPLAVAMKRDNPPPARHARPGRLVGAALSLPDGDRVQSAVSLDRNRAVSLLYGMCDTRHPAGKTEGAWKPFQGWQINRSLECDGGGEPISLEGGRLPAAGWEDRCTLVVNPIPAGSLPPGSCNFEVTLQRPGVATETRSLALEVATASTSTAADTQP